MSSSTHGRVGVLGIDVDPLTMDETVSRCREFVEAAVPVQHVSVNAHTFALLEKDARLRQIFRHAALVSVDGQSVCWAARLLGRPVPQRVAVPDLLDRLLALAEDRGYRVFILGATEPVLARAVAEIVARYPSLNLVGQRNGYFGDDDAERVCEEVRAARPQIVVVGMTSPKKDYWIDDHLAHYKAALSIGVGGALDIIAGDVRRAPAAVQRAGLEWAFRLSQEPRRLFRRYLVTNTRFVVRVAAELVRKRLGYDLFGG